MPQDEQNNSSHTAAEQVTVVMHTYNRPGYFEHYAQSGLYDGMRLLIVDDGSEAEVVRQLQEAARLIGGEVYHYTPNQGVAVATAAGMRRTTTDHVMMVGDDDFFREYEAFAPEAVSLLAGDTNVLMATMPDVHYMHAETGQHYQKYDRRTLDGMKALTVLEHFVRKGEMYVFQAGSMMRTREAEPLVAEPFFRVSEDYVLMVRLCAKYPDRVIRVLDQGAYVRLIHDRSLSRIGPVRPEQNLIHLVSLFVGAHHLMALGRMEREEFSDILIERGEKLEALHGFGKEAARVCNELMMGRSLDITSPEAAFTLTVLSMKGEDLPPEFIALLPEPSEQLLREGRGVTGHGLFGWTPTLSSSAVPALLENNTRADGVTVLMPLYNRITHFAQYVKNGYWDRVPLQVLDDASRKPVADRLDELASEKGFKVVHQPQNRGVAQTLKDAVTRTDTSHLVIVGDDDYFVDYRAFEKEARHIWASRDDALLVAMPFMYEFAEEQLSLQYDRTEWAGMTGDELLEVLCQDGEMRALGAGTMFRTEDLEGIMGDGFFRMAGDFVTLARLCARYPDRKVYVTESGAYHRLIHDRSITAASKFTPQKAVMHLMSIAVAAYYLLEKQSLSAERYRDLLWSRAEVLEKVYGLGEDVVRVMIHLLLGLIPKLETPHARQVADFLYTHLEALPAEFVALVPASCIAFLSDRTRIEAAMGEEDRTQEPLPIDPEQAESLSAIIEAVQQGEAEKSKALLNAHKTRYPDDTDVPTLEATLCLHEGDGAGAVRVLTQALVQTHDHFGHLLMLGNILVQGGATAEAAKLYTRADRVARGQEKEQMSLIWEELAGEGITQGAPGPRIAFIVKEGMGNFLRDLMREMVLDYEVRLFEVSGTRGVDEALHWGDICWFEWCNGPLVYGSSHLLAREKKIICRLHRYEAFREYPLQVEWENVDKLLLVTEHLGVLMEELVPEIRQKVSIETFHNGVNLEEYTFSERSSGFNIAYVGYLHMRKNPMLLLQIVAKLVAIDTRYQLFVAGEFQDSLAKLYWEYMVKEMGMKGHVHLEGWQEDISGWLEDKSYIISTSIHESFGYSIAEAMARGIKPVVHNFVFASQIWAEEMLFNTVDEAVAMIRSPEYQSGVYRRFIQEHYALETQVGQALNLFHAMTTTPPSAQGAVLANITDLHPASINAMVTLECGSCGTSFTRYQGTIAGIALGTHRCPICGTDQLVLPGLFLEALEEAKPEEAEEALYRQVQETTTLAARWSEEAPWEEIMTYEGVNLGACMAFEILPVIVKSHTNA